MKRIFTVLFIVMMGWIPLKSIAQEEILKFNYNNQKGEFHIGLNNLAHTEDWGGRVSITPRIGYSFTDLDMVYLDFTLSGFNKNGYEGFNFESTLEYRRYFKSGQFRPFMQFGAGIGYRESEERLYGTWDYRNYYKAETGIGVSYRHKRWTFEVGMKGVYNQYGNGRVQFAPMVGVSFSF